MHDFSFINTLITENEVNALKSLENNDKYLEDVIAKSLLDFRLINTCYYEVDSSWNPVPNRKYSISENGKRFLIYRSKVSKAKYYENLRYAITTLIAIIALLISLLKS